LTFRFTSARGNV